MPLFDLYCPKCKLLLGDRLLKSGAEAICSDCGATMSKVVSKANFELKGQCWAKDGYK